MNERMGGKSTYSEELYTTSISDKKFTKEQRAYAERMAREIEGKVTTNVHLAEERGQRELAEAMEGDMDEEDKYSMVLNNPRHNEAPAAGAAKPVDVSDGGAAKEGNGGAAAAPSAEGAAAPSAEAPSGEKASAPAAGPTASSKLRASARFVPGGFKPAGGRRRRHPRAMVGAGYGTKGAARWSRDSAAAVCRDGERVWPGPPSGYEPSTDADVAAAAAGDGNAAAAGPGYPAQQQQQAAMCSSSRWRCSSRVGTRSSRCSSRDATGGPMSPQ